MLVPGDKIGEMVITEAEAWDWSTNLYSRCEGPGDRTEETLEDGTVVIEVTCQLAPGLDILFSCGASAGSAQGCFGRLSTRLLRQAQHLCRMRCAAGGLYEIWRIRLEQYFAAAAQRLEMEMYRSC